jgi:hypothetical protein
VIATATTVDEYLTEGPQIEVALGDSTTLAARINKWLAEHGIDGAPSFPASNEIVLDVLPGSNPLAMNADRARAVAAGLHDFADQLTAMAAELDALGGGQ